MRVEQRLRDLGLALPEPVQPVGAYARYVRTGRLLIISGTGPPNDAPRGKVDTEVTIDQAYRAAREAGLRILATAKDALGDLDRVQQVVKVLGRVNAVPEFECHARVIDGCTDLFVEIFGDAGRGARAAVGMGSLPNRICVQVECTMEVD